MGSDRFRKFEDDLRKRGFEFDEDLLYNVVFKGGTTTISKRFDSQAEEDICNHVWRLLDEKLEAAKQWSSDCEVYLCERSGCVKFQFKHRTSFIRFLYFFRLMRAIDRLLPRKGAFFTPWLFEKEYGIDKEAIRKYLELIRGLDIDGQLAYIEVGDRRLFYRCDDRTDKPILLPLSLEEAELFLMIINFILYYYRRMIAKSGG